jgi:hypothetical protein
MTSTLPEKSDYEEYDTMTKIMSIMLAIAVVLTINLNAAEAEVIGSQAAGTGSYLYRGSAAMGMRIVAPDDIVINEMSAHVADAHTATVIRGVVYHDVNRGGNGAIWEFVAATDIANINDGWNALSFPSNVELFSGEIYLLAHVTDGQRYMGYNGSDGGRVWAASVDIHSPEVDQPVQLAYHYGAWAEYSLSSEADSKEAPDTEVPVVYNNDDLVAYIRLREMLMMHPVMAITARRLVL